MARINPGLPCGSSQWKIEKTFGVSIHLRLFDSWIAVLLLREVLAIRLWAFFHESRVTCHLYLVVYTLPERTLTFHLADQAVGSSLTDFWSAIPSSATKPCGLEGVPCDTPIKQRFLGIHRAKRPRDTEENWEGRD